jgi:hypothetical protein
LAEEVLQMLAEEGAVVQGIREMLLLLMGGTVVTETTLMMEVGEVAVPEDLMVLGLLVVVLLQHLAVAAVQAIITPAVQAVQAVTIVTVVLERPIPLVAAVVVVEIMVELEVTVEARAQAAEVEKMEAGRVPMGRLY